MLTTLLKDLSKSILFYSILYCRGNIDDFATIPFHLVLFSVAPVELAKSIPVYSLILSFNLFFCLPLLFPFIVFCRSPLLNKKTLIQGQTTLVSVSWPGSGVRHILQWLLVVSHPRVLLVSQYVSVESSSLTHHRPYSWFVCPLC